MAMIDVLVHFFGSKVDFILEMFCRCKRYVRYCEVIHIAVCRYGSAGCLVLGFAF